MTQSQTATDEPELRRNIRGLSILQVSLGSIIGSGWLFGALFAAQIAGPAALITWVIGSLAMVVLALNHAELGSMYSVAGGSARFAHYAYGTVAGFSIAWFAWLSGAATAPIEVEAALQYATNYVPWLTHSVDGVTVLQPVGYLVAVALLAIFTVINLFAIKLIAKVNSIITWWKVATLALTIIVIAATRFHVSNLMAHGGFAPFGAHGIVAALSLGGVIFAFTGFEQAVQLGGETKRPGRNIPLALLGSLAVVSVLYLGLQFVFLGGLEPRQLAHGWANISFRGIYGPFAGLATALGLSWLAYILYADAIVSPGGNGLIYVTTTSRLSYGMSRNQTVPTVFERVNPRTGIPTYGVILTFLVGVVFLLPFPGWQTLVGFITSAVALMWAGAPVALGALRRALPQAARPFRLRAAVVLCPGGFAIANLIVYWSGWTADWKLFVCAVIGFVVLAASWLNRPADARPELDLRSATWIAPWLGGLAIISYIGQFNSPAHLIFGLGHIAFGWDIVVVVLFSVAIYYLALAVRLPAQRVLAYTEAVEVVPVEPVELVQPAS